MMFYEIRTYLQMSNNSVASEECYEDPAIADGMRVFLVAGVGSVLCSLGVIFNSVLLIVFSKMPCTRNHLLYMVCLCLFDILVEISYMVNIDFSFHFTHQFQLLFTVSVLYDYYHFYALYILWHEYARIVSTLAQVIFQVISYCIMASLQRVRNGATRRLKW
uniref:G-protein coupled receptors family 1 profile domain-containing protein n=1 Tax=Ascaris lumbricoides TaxID=6252 RepID=A0A9J2Q5N9_ASCLU